MPKPKGDKETPAPEDIKPPEQPGQDPPEQETEHPQFDKRIKELDGKLHAIQDKHTAERQVWEQKSGEDRQAFQTLSTQYQDLTKTLDKLEDKAFVSEAPNYDDDPKGYMDWRTTQAERKFEKMLKTTSPPKPTSQSTSQPVHVQEAAQEAMHDDYKEIIAEANKDIQKDSALSNAIWDSPNPYKAAYDYGVRKRKVAEELRQGNLDRAYVEDGTPPPQDATSLSPEDKACIAKMRSGGADITEEKFLAHKQTIAKRKGR